MGRWGDGYNHCCNHSLGTITIHWSTGNKKLAIQLAAFFRADVELAVLIISHRLAQKVDTINKSDLKSATFTQ